MRLGTSNIQHPTRNIERDARRRLVAGYFTLRLKPRQLLAADVSLHAAVRRHSP